MHKSPHGKHLPVGDREEGPGAPVGSQRGGGSEPLYAIPLHREGKYKGVCVWCFFLFVFISFYNHF